VVCPKPTDVAPIFWAEFMRPSPSEFRQGEGIEMATDLMPFQLDN